MTEDRGLAGPLDTRAASLWVVGIAFFGVGDVVTTSAGLVMGDVTEAGPVVAPLVRSYGPGTVLPLKAAAFGLACLLWRVTPSPHDVGVPLGLAALGVLVTGWNAAVLLLAAGIAP